MESAVAGLPPDKQWSLWTWLQARLAERQGGHVARHTDTPAETEAWVAELGQLRANIGTGRAGISLAQPTNEIREERFVSLDANLSNGARSATSLQP